MPTYDYRCTGCDTEKEEMHSMTETPVITCEKCGTPMKIKISLGADYKMVSDGTRRRAYAQRYGGKTKKSSFTPTAMESANLKAIEQSETKRLDKLNREDPYAAWRS
jgi:putative FmdB family regulatory protein